MTDFAKGGTASIVVTAASDAAVVDFVGEGTATVILTATCGSNVGFYEVGYPHVSLKAQAWGRNILAGAVSVQCDLPPAGYAVPADVDIAGIAADLAGLADEMASRLTSAGSHASSAVDADACRRAAGEALSIRELLGGG